MAKLTLIAASIAIVVVAAFETNVTGRFERSVHAANQRAITVHIVPVVQVDSSNLGSEFLVEDMLRLRSSVFTPSVSGPNLCSSAGR
jgi:hypothetical protein